MNSLVTSITPAHRQLTWLIIVASLGYFVDVYDLLLFNVVRVASLQSLGVAANDLMTVGKTLQNCQAWGLLLGGFCWGILGDRRGRISVLFGSIVLYSAANLLNGFVTSLWQYEVLRFTAGFGLAGELGAGITLASEGISKEKRGYGTMLIAAIGLLGAVGASIAGKWTDWRSAYFIGGGMGLALLILRFSVRESDMFQAVARREVRRGSLLLVFQSWERSARFLRCALVGLPVYFIVGVLMAFAPEFAQTLHLPYRPLAGDAVLWCYAAMSLGDFACSGFSQGVRSRRLAFTIFHAIGALGILLYLFHPAPTLNWFYAQCALVGFGAGYWALISQYAAEQFGTNLRATVTTVVPNLVRAALIPINLMVASLRPGMGLVHASAWVGIATVIIALVAVWRSQETFARSLDFEET